MMRKNDTPITVEINGNLDLHTFHPRDAKNVVTEYLHACREAGILQVRIIHGKGTGTLRRIVHSTLEKIDSVQTFRLADETGESWGAPLVDLTKP